MDEPKLPPTEPTGGNVDPLEVQAAPTVTLGKHVLSILELPARKNRVVTPMVMDMMDTFLRAFQASQNESALALKLTEDEFDRFLKIVAIGASCAHPEVTFDKMLDWKFGTLELIQAVVVVAAQSGLMPKKVVPGPLVPTLAETLAMPLPTGTLSPLKLPFTPDGTSTGS